MHYVRGGRGGGEQSTILDGCLLVAIVIVLGAGSPYGQLAAEVAIIAVLVLTALRGLQIVARRLADRRDKAPPAGRS